MNRSTLPLLLLAVVVAGTAAAKPGVRLKELARIEGVRDNALVGYGLVVGLSGTGDSARNRATVQSLANALAEFGVTTRAEDLAGRNAAAVIVTATLPPFAEGGQRLDVQVSSIGDARSLVGGTLLLTPLNGPDRRLYALAQGALSVGGYEHELFANSVRKNHPTVGVISGGAIVERGIPAPADAPRDITVLLHAPDFTTATRVAEAIGRTVPGTETKALHAGKITVHLTDPKADTIMAIAAVEAVVVEPDARARVVINERTGTVVAGGDVRLGPVSIAHGDLKVTITTRFDVSQPDSFLFRPSESIRTTVVPETDIAVDEPATQAVEVPGGSSVADLVGALRAIRLTTRDVISILQAISAAGALHGELIVQ